MANSLTALLKCIKPIITPHYFRHNYVTMLYEAGVDSLIAMKIVGHTDYQTTANIYTHMRDEMLKKSTVNMGDVFRNSEMTTKRVPSLIKRWLEDEDPFGSVDGNSVPDGKTED